MSRDDDRKDAYISNELQLHTHSLTFIRKNKSFLSAASILPPSPMTYNTTAYLGKLTCTDYIDFGKCQNRFGSVSWSRKDSNYLDVKLKFFEEDDNIELLLVRNLTMRGADFNQFTRLKNQLVIAAEYFVCEENLSPLVIPSLSKDIDEQLKLAHKVVDVVDWANRKICVTLLRYIVDKPERSNAQVRLFAKKNDDEKFQQIVEVKTDM